ncbi:sugar ABC transporter ATP-binding protein [Nocardia rhamnosiphila]|uniref:sugar ABC transporter ATP-binding protein n=1 Tax=Nocardia rhamnosiphila TaxID=426716 RepID=UPI000B1CBE48|nr:sugar ABC transporter ATP-binding protein [Nocardia rhamnosiphila]
MTTAPAANPHHPRKDTMDHRADDPAVVVEIEGLTKHYAGVQALTDASVTIRAGEVRALLGRNGAGKSTMIRLLAGVETPDRGTIRVGGELLGDGGVRRSTALGIETVHQELSLVPELTVAENMFLGVWPRTAGRVDYDAMRRETAAVLEKLALDIDPLSRVESLPLAEQQLVEICRAVRRQPRLLILDEPTSALAAAEVQAVLTTVNQIAAAGVAVVYVSHRLDEIRQVASTATVMRDGRVVETVSLEDVGTAHVVGLMVGSVESAVEERAERVVDRSGTPLLSVRNLVLAPVIREVSFDVHPGEVLGIAGLMGSGRSELLRAVAGFHPISSGSVAVAGTEVRGVSAARMKALGVGMTPEDRKGAGIVPMLGVDENMVISDYRAVSSGPTIMYRRFRDVAAGLISRLSIATARAETPIVNLSGGNQQKAVIGRWLHAGSRILLLDEPTRGVDVAAKSQIYRLVRELADGGTAVVFVSGELEELPLVCDRVIALRGGEIAEELTGSDITIAAVLAAAMAA